MKINDPQVFSRLSLSSSQCWPRIGENQFSLRGQRCQKYCSRKFFGQAKNVKYLTNGQTQGYWCIGDLYLVRCRVTYICLAAKVEWENCIVSLMLERSRCILLSIDPRSGGWPLRASSSFFLFADLLHCLMQRTMNAADGFALIEEGKTRTKWKKKSKMCQLIRIYVWRLRPRLMVALIWKHRRC